MVAPVPAAQAHWLMLPTISTLPSTRYKSYTGSFNVIQFLLAFIMIG